MLKFNQYIYTQNKAAK